MKFTLQDVLEIAIDQRIATIHTGLPGRIEFYDDNQRRANVQPLIKKVYVNGTIQSLPIINNVPVILPATETAGLKYPVKVGDIVWLSFAERSLDQWKSIDDETEPGNNRKYDLPDAVAFPGLAAFTSNAIGAQDAVSLYHKEGKIKIDNSGKIAIGNSQAELLDIINQTLTVLIQAIPSAASQFENIQQLLDQIKGSL